jgi:hypothetical protein
LLVADCFAIIIAIPTPMIVMVFPEIVATELSELIYVNGPLLVDIGCGIVNGLSPYVFVGIENSLIEGVALAI